MGILDVIAEEKKIAEEEARKFNHEKYKNNFLRLIKDKPKKFIGDVYQADRENPNECAKDASGNIIKPVVYAEGTEIVCCPEPIEFISEFNDYVDDQDQCKRIMRELIDGRRSRQSVRFKRIMLDHEPSNGIWFNRTDNGVNLRPGLLDGEMGQRMRLRWGIWLFTAWSLGEPVQVSLYF